MMWTPVASGVCVQESARRAATGDRRVHVRRRSAAEDMDLPAGWILTSLSVRFIERIAHVGLSAARSWKENTSNYLKNPKIS